MADQSRRIDSHPHSEGITIDHREHQVEESRVELFEGDPLGVVVDLFEARHQMDKIGSSAIDGADGTEMFASPLAMLGEDGAGIPSLENGCTPFYRDGEDSVGEKKSGERLARHFGYSVGTKASGNLVGAMA